MGGMVLSAMGREQAARLPEQHRRHQHVDQDRGHGRARARRGGGPQQALGEQRHEGAPGGVHQPDQQRPHQRTADGADAADHDHHEGQDENALAHAHLHGQQRPEHAARDGAERSAQREDAGEQPAHIGAHGHRHLAVGGAGTHLHADARARDQHIEQQRHRQADADDEQPVGRVGEARQQFHRAGQRGRRIERHRLRAPDHAHGLVGHQQDREGAQHLREMVSPVEPPQHRHLQQHADRRRGERAAREADPERARRRGDGRDQVGAHHVERAVRQVDHVHDAEHQREAGGQQEQHQPELQAVERLLEKQEPRHARDRPAASGGHAAFAGVGIGMRLEHAADGLVGDAALPVLHHLAQVVILHGVVVGVEAERPAHGFERRGLQRLAQCGLVLQLAAHAAHGAVDEPGSVVALRGIQRRQAAVFLLEVGHEALVGGVVHVVRPLRAVEDAHHGIAHRADHVLIGREARCEELHLLAQAGAGELLDEVHAQAARQEHEHRIRTGGADLGQLRTIVELAQRRVGLHHHLALVVALEAGQRVLARRVVGREQGHLLEAAVLHRLADGLVHVVVLVGGAEEVRIALRPRVLRRPGVGADVEGARLEHRLAHGQHHVGEHDTGHEIHALALDQPVGRLLGGVGALLVVRHGHFGRQVAELARALLHCELEAVADVDAEARSWAGQRGQQADLHLVRRLGATGEQGDGRADGGGECRGTVRAGREEWHRRLLGSGREAVDGRDGWRATAVPRAGIMPGHVA